MGSPVPRLIHGLSTQLMTIQINLSFLRRFIPSGDLDGLGAYQDLTDAIERSVIDFKSLRELTIAMQHVDDRPSISAGKLATVIKEIEHERMKVEEALEGS